jgi:CRP/FNR family transcriptional regulator, anaerobic regulatory protein
MDEPNANAVQSARLPWPSAGRAALPTGTPLPPSACKSCGVRHFCLGREVDELAGQLLDRIGIARKRVHKGQPLYHEGEPFSFLYAVYIGTLKSSLSTADGAEHVLTFKMPGDMLGFDGIANGRYATTATALEDTEACAIPYERLMRGCAESVALQQRLTQLMASQMVRDCRSAKLISARHAEHRVAGFLLQHSGWMEERGYSAREFELRMSRADIGSYLGTSLETVSRSLSLFAREGFIKVRSRRVEILQVEGLREASSARCH